MPTPQSGKMVPVPAGEFLMGSTAKQADNALNICNKYNHILFPDNQCKKELFDTEQQQHKVYLDAFQIDKYEVTNEQYAACMQAGRCEAAHFDDGTCYVYSGGSSWKQGTLLQSFRGANQPVVCVDWNQSKAFCEWDGKGRGNRGRLPI